jgi:hypothetical protein
MREFERELVRDLRRVEVVPQGLSEASRLANQRGGSSPHRRALRSWRIPLSTAGVGKASNRDRILPLRPTLRRARVDTKPSVRKPEKPPALSA